MNTPKRPSALRTSRYSLAGASADTRMSLSSSARATLRGSKTRNCRLRVAAASSFERPAAQHLQLGCDFAPGNASRGSPIDVGKVWLPILKLK